MRNLAALVFVGGLAFLLLVIFNQFDFAQAPMIVGQGILTDAPDRVGAANIVTAVVLGYRGIDTLGEISILFAASVAAGLVLGRRRTDVRRDPPGGFILRSGVALLFPLMLVVGFYIILHGHLTPGGGFQGGVILAAAFFLPLLARPETPVNHAGLSIVEGGAGAVFILTGLAALLQGGEFLQPLLDNGVLGELVSAGTLPLLYLAVGLKVGAELAGLMARLADVEVDEP
ncbi:MAG: sodium:proton antiporter [Gammaproteobacteria bacterium (ex Lamellibrachia satsuma)]|nr:MAG: sodium:proton antiporter [Gammaproteobacteria bacterium (ex Lamellibrachia satsuma)]RRS33357.1 MAG: sodium:proton antiporter [Gammaproteobacteria bacterium (ex Lamellibrachia satsuma)]RRS36676.1 MAG: sodium:proton antiporter [Gammaproteobacteria bacterium (ex Lamellibrachia satsuma)]